MKRARIAVVALLCTPVLSVGVPARRLAESGERKLAECKMTYNLKGWSAFYKTATGDGTITCSNGQSARVKISVEGGGITFGKSEITDGTGLFTGARDISELFGSYAQAEAHAGVVKSGDVQAMTKGEVSLVLSGTGRGVDIGIAFAKVTIERAK
jgi:hypothetical protein